MRYALIVTVLVILTAAASGCGDEISLSQHTAPNIAISPFASTTIPLKQQPTTTSPPSATPIPRVNSQWYVERNMLIQEAIKRYQPWRDSQEIFDIVEMMYIDPDKPMVALTFDDGPVLGVTDQILDVLAQYNVRATFFICGWRLKDQEVKSILQRMIVLGCEIGNHTWAHHDLQEQNIVEKRRAIIDVNEAVFDATGYAMHAIRPPGGHNDWDVNRIARDNGMAVILWSQSGNVHEYNPEKIAENVQKQIVNGKELHDGDIILLHDTKSHMLDAVKIIVPQLLDQGYQLVTVWELLNCSEDGFIAGETYSCQTIHQ